MKKFDSWYFPDGEIHLIENMAATNKKRDGRLTYQCTKYETAFFYADKTMCAIDVGAHVGLWSYFLARDFKHVYAFEPVQNHIECFEKNLESAQNVTLYKTALGKEHGSVNIDTNPQSSGDAFIRGNGAIPLAPLDSFGLNNIGLIKIDCEGYESNVIAGAVNTIKKNKPVVIVEQKRDMSEKYGLPKLSAVKMLQDMGAVLKNEISGDYILAWE